MLIELRLHLFMMYYVYRKELSMSAKFTFCLTLTLTTNCDQNKMRKECIIKITVTSSYCLQKKSVS